MRKFLLCSLVLTNMLPGGGGANDAFATTNKGIVEVKESDGMTSLPKTEAWKTAPLDTTPMTFNMFVTGNCAAPENKDIIITGNSQVPDFFDVNDGQFVFRKPAPMATIQVPAGYGSTYLTITLQGVTNNDFSNIKNYVALGVREKTAAEGTYSAILNMSSKTSECFHIDENNIGSGVD